MFLFRKKRTKKKSLFELLDLNPFDSEQRKRLDCDAIIQEVRQNPISVQSKYTFSLLPDGVHHDHYPLFMAILLRASLEVVDALYTSYPPAVEEVCEGKTLLHHAIKYSPFPEVILFLLDKWPDAAREKDKHGDTPLHFACAFACKGNCEVVSSLIDSWPGALAEKDSIGYLPLHCACSLGASLEVVSLLMDRYPEALKEKCIYRYHDPYTPVHLACRNKSTSLEVILMLLGKWPQAARQGARGEIPLDVYQKYSKQSKKSTDIEKVLFFVSQICGDKRDCVFSQRDFMDFFIDIKWRDGIALVLDRCPSVAEDTLISTGLKIVPELLSFVGNRCSIRTVWHMVSNMQDVLAGI